MSLTAAQQDAINARGDVLVVAGAGTGKTRTLVERCLHCLAEAEPRASLDELLMVTFTEAAAAEMRQRIRTRLVELAAEHPQDTHWLEQIALFDSAHIGTLHSFCLKLVRQHFYELELDPQMAVLAEEEARLLAEETLTRVLDRHYADRGANANPVQLLIQAQSRGWDKPIRALVLKLHHYTQTRPDPVEWLRQQKAYFGSEEPEMWRKWIDQALKDWREQWTEVLNGFSGDNSIAKACLKEIAALPASFSRKQMAGALGELRAIAETCPHGKTKSWFEPLKDFFAEATFLFSLTVDGSGTATVEPLAEDWRWVRGQMSSLLELAQEFTRVFTETKRELGVVDFHDLEQYSLRLLWDWEKKQPTETAVEWQKKLRFIFVDEYQDINAAQDKIIEALSRDPAEGNRFLVGDVKQSIYRFRLAEPRIFLDYLRKWKNPGGTIALVENFRSREGILDFINSLFGKIMRPEAGGIAYDEEARLKFGARADRRQLSMANAPGPCVELHIRMQNTSTALDNEETSEELIEIGELEETQKEARMVALRLRELHASKFSVWDETASQFRPGTWGDCVILLRSPARKVEGYAKEFSHLNVPLVVARGGFYSSLEVSDLLSLLKLLDNPLQDLPLLAVLHSPLVGLTVDELATIRLVKMKVHFWTALTRWAQTRGAFPEAGSEGTDHNLEQKVSTFLGRFARWRRLARRLSVSRCLESVLAETHYGDWLLTQPRGEQRHANIDRLVSLAQQFDQFQRQGLFRFLRFIAAQEMAETEPEVVPLAGADAVRLMSIHQSKGLEFPVVVIADLGKPFNQQDLQGDIIFDEEYGLCPQVKPPHVRKRYPSLAFWIARRRQRRELLGEELRLLYVAMTRARDRLLLTSTISKKRFEEKWQGKETDGRMALAVRSYADWLGEWFASIVTVGDKGAKSRGKNALFEWGLHDDRELVTTESEILFARPASLPLEDDANVWHDLRERLIFKYSFKSATQQPAKTSASALRRRVFAAEAEDTTSLFNASGRNERFRDPARRPGARRKFGSVKEDRFSAAEVGNAHHIFLENVRLEKTHGLEELRQEAERLERGGTLSREEVAVLDMKALSGFWTSKLGYKIREKEVLVQRELAFTARFGSEELARFSGEPQAAGAKDEFVIVQGVADLVVIFPEKIWLIDFKTDGGGSRSDRKHHELQVQLYALALSRIYKRPVEECWLYYLGGGEAVAVGAAGFGAGLRITAVPAEHE